LRPCLIISFDIPIVIATAAAAVAFLTLCNPKRGIFIFFIYVCFFLVIEYQDQTWKNLLIDKYF